MRLCKFKILIFFAFSLFCNVSYAQVDQTRSQIDDLAAQNNQTNQTINQTNDSAGNALKRASELAQASEESGSQANLVGGAAMIATGVALNASSMCGCAGIPLIIYGSGMVSQGSSLGRTAGQTNFDRGTFVNSNSLGGITSTQSGEEMWANPFASQGIGDRQVPTTKKLIQDLKAQGFNVDLDKNSITLPDGSEHSLSEFNSKESMSKAGFDAGGIDKAFDMKADLEKKFKKAIPKVVAMKLKNGGGGASAGGSTTTSSSDPFANIFGNKGKDRSPANTDVAGMAKLRQGELIGVAGDDIFKMINRRYDAKCRQGALIGCD